MCCFQCVKDIKFESNSQLDTRISVFVECCFQCVKDIKFESNSQLRMKIFSFIFCCFQCVKDIKFESNSQLIGVSWYVMEAVSSVSKI